MADIIHTDDLGKYDPTSTLQIYNGLDCCVTSEVFSELEPQLDENTRLIYDFERAMQAPALEMMLRGIRIDVGRLHKTLDKLQAWTNRIRYIIDRIADAVWGAPLNPNSPAQVKEFFYKALKVPPIRLFRAGKSAVSTSREALEKLSTHRVAGPIAAMVLNVREMRKLSGTLRRAVDRDRRIRTSYNVAGTETGRWSSSRNAFGTGTNLQNITEGLRHLFIADPGKKMAYIDLQQAESRAVGLLVLHATHDPSYLDACETGDLHTAVCKMVWPDLAWTGENDRRVADKIYYRHFSYYDMAKRLGHATNYYGKPRTLAAHLKVEVAVVELFQGHYFKAFPGIRDWHHYVARKLQTEGQLTTPLGRRRQFWNRLRDDTTLREAIAFVPQSMVGDILNLGLWRIWNLLDVEVLGQVHDAVLVQYPEPKEEHAIFNTQVLMKIPITLGTHTITIPTDASVGWNWGHASDTNPDGLVGWTGIDERRRTDNPEVSLFHRVIR